LLLPLLIAGCGDGDVPPRELDREPGGAGAPGMAGAPGAAGAGAHEPEACESSGPPRAPLRRLSRYEYNNTVRDLLGDSSAPAKDFPSEESGNGFGNDADSQSVSLSLAESYVAAASSLATTASTSERLAELFPCTATATGDEELDCAREVAETLTNRAYRREPTSEEVDELVTLFEGLRPSWDFRSSVAGMLEVVLQSPDFLYRPELGRPVKGRDDVLRPTANEMATRLSYLFWGSMPDEALREAADTGTLDTPAGIREQAKRLLADYRTRDTVRFFFDNLLPIASLSSLERDRDTYPAFSAKLGSLMRLETQTFLEYHIFYGPGTWPSVFTADYTFMNEPLARFYGLNGVQGDDFQFVGTDPERRRGLLTQAGMVAGTIHSNRTNPVVRGSFVIQKLLCHTIPLPSPEIFAMVKEPDVDAAATARERFTQHSEDAACFGCHINMDPVGFALENFDAIGQWRDEESGEKIDARGQSPLLGEFDGPVGLGKAMARSELVQRCFATNWLNFGYGRVVGDDEACSAESVQQDFKASGYDIQELLLALTQSEAFLYLPAVKE
jgi:hypothetical protein